MTLQLASRPFRAGASARLPARAAALAQLRQCVECGPSITVIAGENGSGKTSLALNLLHSLVESHTPIYLPNAGYQSPAKLYQAIVHDLDQPASNDWLAVSDALISCKSKPLIALDDADAASDAVLADLRRFDNIAVSILLIGSPNLHSRLMSLPAIAARLERLVIVEQLSSDDSVRFLQSQLTNSEYTLSDEAAKLIAEAGQGSPRRLNRIASLALSLSLEAGETGIDVEAALEAVSQLSEPATATESTMSSRTPDQPRGVRTPKQKARKRTAA